VLCWRKWELKVRERKREELNAGVKYEKRRKKRKTRKRKEV
jgi:hypothetical protein